MKRLLSALKEIIVSIYSMFLMFFIHRRENYIVFGSWCGELYGDNSKYLAEYIIKNCPEYKVFWVGKKYIKKELPTGLTFIELDRVSSISKLLKCKYFFFTQMHRPDISRYNVYKGAVLCLLDHGNALKKWGMDAVDYDGHLEYNKFGIFRKLYTNIIGENYPYSFITVSSDKTAEAYKTALAYRIGKNTQIIGTGLPRNDILNNYYNVEYDSLKEKYAKLLGFPSDSKVVLYVPTFRRKNEKNESFADREMAEIRRLEKVLKEGNAVLLEKNHFVSDLFSVNKTAKDSPLIIKIDRAVMKIV